MQTTDNTQMCDAGGVVQASVRCPSQRLDQVPSARAEFTPTSYKLEVERTEDLWCKSYRHSVDLALDKTC